MGKLVLLFTVIPAIEIFFLIKVGEVIGGMNTVMTIILTGVVGAYYARQQGFEVLMRMQRATGEGRMPASEMIDGGMLLVGGALLVTPGFLTDFLGFSFIFPPLRALWKGRVVELMRRKAERGEIIIQKY